MHAGLVRIGRWVVGAGFAAVTVLAHAQHFAGPFGGFGFGHGPRAAAMVEAQYRGGVTPVSAQARQTPPRSSESAIRAGSIREDVARYNEERAAFRPFARGGDDGARPPMPSPYRN